MQKYQVLVLCVFAAVNLTACGEDADSGTNVSNNNMPMGLEVIGEWSDNFGGMTTITAEKWGADALIEFDNAANIAIVQAPADAMFGANQFSRHRWTEPKNGVFYLCTEVFGKATAAAAKMDPATSDATNPEAGGCGGQFPWTKMTAK
jgi:hypothetical protein